MANPALADLVARYQADPTAILRLPGEAAARTAFYDATKVAVAQAVDAGDWARADQLAAFARAVAEQRATPEDQAWAQWCQGLALIFRDPQRALGPFEAAGTFYRNAGRNEEAGRVLLNTAFLFGQLGRLDDAATAIEHSAAALADFPTYRNWPSLHLNRSDILGRRGDYVGMLTSAQTAEAAAIQFDQPSNQVRSLINQAVAALALGDLAGASRTLTQAEAVNRAVNSVELRGRIAINQARLAIYRGELFAALHALERARAAFAEAALDIDQATIAIDEASLYTRLYMPALARRAAERAAEAFASAGIGTESVEARIIAVRLALAQGQPNEARRHLAAAETFASQVAPLWQAVLEGLRAHPLLQRTATERRVALAAADAASERLRLAGSTLEWLEAALLGAALSPRTRDARERYLALITAAHDHGLPEIEARACTALADRLPPDEACVWLRRSADLLTAMRQHVPTEELKAHLLSGTSTVYAQLLTAQLASNQTDAALMTLLEAKGGLWADLALPAAAPEDPAWVRARATVDYWHAEAREAATPAYAAHCAAEVHAAEQALMVATRQRARPRPVLPVPTLAAIQQALPPDAILVDYLVGPTDLLACIISATDLPRWVRVGSSAPLTALVSRLGTLIAAIQHAPPEARGRAAQAQAPLLDTLLAELGAALVSPLQLLGVSQLIIAPDDWLFTVPWAALRGAWTSEQERTLGEQMALTLIPSAVVLAIGNTQPSSGSTALPLALGAPGDPPLLAVQQELDTLSTLFPAGRCVFPAQRRDLTEAPTPSMLHIAMHGHVVPQAPLLSRLHFADGPVLLADVLQLDLHGTALVTLSACETGVIPERGGVVLALAGAFLCAGADAVLASLWAVDDQVTALLMRVLYTALRQQLPLAHAVQIAQQAVRASGYAHPYFWAAFQPLCRRV